MTESWIRRAAIRWFDRFASDDPRRDPRTPVVTADLQALLQLAIEEVVEEAVRTVRQEGPWPGGVRAAIARMLDDRFHAPGWKEP